MPEAVINVVTANPAAFGTLADDAARVAAYTAQQNLNALRTTQCVQSVAQSLTASAELALLKTTADDIASHLAIVQSNPVRGPVLTLIRDQRTGEMFAAQNLGAVPEELHPILQSRLEKYLMESGQNLNPRWGVPGSHSDFAALNQAMLRREAIGLPVTTLDDFGMYNTQLWRNRLGVPVDRCGNCGVLTDGVRVFSGR